MRRPDDEAEEEEEEEEEEDDGRLWLSSRLSFFCGNPKNDDNQGTKGPRQWPLDDDDDDEEDDVFLLFGCPSSFLCSPSVAQLQLLLPLSRPLRLDAAPDPVDVE